ncbi:MAG: IclR family transcriptional regulator [Sphingomonas sp.]
MIEEDRRAASPQSVERVIRILEALCAAPGAVSLADLSRTLATPKSSLAALLRGLSDMGFVVAGDGTYRLGAGAFGLGSALLAARRRVHSSDLVREGMRRLADRSGETVLFAVRDADADTMTYVDVIESRNPVRFTVSIGDRRPLYCTAGGRALLAAAPEADVARYLDGVRPERRAAGTQTDRARLADAIAAARRAGVARTTDEAADGVTGTAAAVLDDAGTVMGALVVAAPSGRLRERGDDLAPIVRAEAERVSRSLGHRPAG